MNDPLDEMVTTTKGEFKRLGDLKEDDEVAFEQPLQKPFKLPINDLVNIYKASKKFTNMNFSKTSLKRNRSRPHSKNWKLKNLALKQKLMNIQNTNSTRKFVTLATPKGKSSR